MAWMAALAGSLTLLLAVPSAPPASSACLALEAPCGYITPLIDLDFPTKVPCPGTTATAMSLARCTPLPGPQQSFRIPGTVRWYWKVSEDLTYPGDPQSPVVVTFAATALDPKFLSFAVEPSEIRIDAAALLDPRRMPADTGGSAPTIYYSYDQAVNVTFTRTGEPSTEELSRLVAKQGVQSFFVKAKSTGSGAYYKEAFGIEEFRFNATALLPQPSPDRQSPMPPAGFGLIILAVVAARQRARVRRRSPARRAGPPSRNA